MIKVQGLKHRYPTAPRDVLAGIDLTIEPGDFVALIGANGCGKTTLARHLNGLLVPTEGRVTVDALDTADPQEVGAIRRLVGMVFQNPDTQMVAPTVEQEVAFGPENLGLEPAELRRRVCWAQEALEVADLAGRDPHLLSGGQKQRVALAAVLAMEPRYLVLDEPTTMLDSGGRRQVLEAISSLHTEHGVAVVLVTHRMEEAALARRVVVLEQGRVLMDDPVEAVFRRAEQLSELGLEVPPVEALAARLRAAGYALPAWLHEPAAFLDSLEALLA